MPVLDFAILADRISTEPSGVGYVMRGGIDTVQAAQVPTVQQLGLLFRLGFTRVECGRPHRFEVVFQDEDGRRLMQAASVQQPVWKEDLPAHWHYHMLGGFNFPIPLPRFGNYAFELLINDNNVKTLQLRVVPRAGDPDEQEEPGPSNEEPEAPAES